MKISFYGRRFIYVIKELEKNGHTIIYNQFSKDVDIVLLEGHQMYDIYPLLKKIKKYKINFVDILIDLPPWHLYPKNNQTYGNYIIKLFLQYFYHITHKYRSLNRILIHLLLILNKHKSTQKFFQITNKLLNIHYRNKIYWQVNYKKFLKKSDLNLSISKFTQFCFKKLANINSKVCYPSINSKLIESIKKDFLIKYDIMNIGRAVAHKRQNLIVNASKKLDLKLMIIGQQQDKNIKLDYPNPYIPHHLNIMRKLKQSQFYIDASIFEGFGMTPIEAVFMDKVVIASDTYIHKEILGNYPLYFIKDNINDLIKKIKQALNNEFQIDKKALNQIKKKYSVESATYRLEKHLKQLYIK